MRLGGTLEAGPLIAPDRADRRVIALLARVDQTGAPVIVPAAALAQAIRDPARQARLARLGASASDASRVPTASTPPTWDACSPPPAPATSPTPMSSSVPAEPTPASSPPTATT